MGFLWFLLKYKLWFLLKYKHRVLKVSQKKGPLFDKKSILSLLFAVVFVILRAQNVNIQFL